MFPKTDKIRTLHHQMGKITFHSVATKEHTLRVRRKADNTLETLSRSVGGKWGDEELVLHPKFQHALLTFLERDNDTSYWYLHNVIVKYVNQRFTRGKH